MELYTKTSYELSRILTLRYSTSFGKSSQLFSAEIREHIFAIYGLVRIADEIVDTYQAKNSLELLNALETQTYEAIKTKYSTNPIVHAFVQTVCLFDIDTNLIKAFFTSMRTDITRTHFTQKQYEAYIYGSAEVIGLMCLKVFVDGDTKEYKRFEIGAKALGAAYQKVNFLRDIASDYNDRGRMYFPGVSFESFNEVDKKAIEQDIADDFAIAKQAITHLPLNARKAVRLSFHYYSELLNVIKKSSVEKLKSERIRVPNIKKLIIRFTPKARQ